MTESFGADLRVRKNRDSWFGRIVRLLERGELQESVWEQLEELLILADVGGDTTGKILQGLRRQSKEMAFRQVSDLRSALRDEMIRILAVDGKRWVSGKGDGLRVVLVVGVNGSGKTTSIAKLARVYQKEGSTVVLAAADTFRAAAAEQLIFLGDRVGAQVVAHKPHGDPGAVVFDALEAGKARKHPVVIVDTAGRLHTKTNLMEELKKISRVIARGGQECEVLMVIDANTGQNGLSQAKYFVESVGVTGIFLSKLDGTAKGGIVFSICDELGVPIRYIGTGERLEDIATFDAEAFVDALLSEEKHVYI